VWYYLSSGKNKILQRGYPFLENIISYKRVESYAQKYREIFKE
jgi:hypothetical protein